MTIRFRNDDFSPGVISHSDSHFSTSERERFRTSSSSFAIARSRRVLYTASRREDDRGMALNRFDSLGMEWVRIHGVSIFHSTHMRYFIDVRSDAADEMVCSNDVRYASAAGVPGGCRANR